MQERRSGTPVDAGLMRNQLNRTQLAALSLLEQLGWELRFVRQSPVSPLPVIFAGDASWAVIRVDGSVDEAPRLRIRHPGL